MLEINPEAAMVEMFQSQRDFMMDRATLKQEHEPSAVNLLSVAAKAQAGPDTNGIHLKKKRIDGLLDSAFLESDRTSERTDALAARDFHDAIKSADSVDPRWLKEQELAISQAQIKLVDSRGRLRSELRAGVDSLPTPTRQKVNELTYSLFNLDVNGGISAESVQIEKKLESLLPPDLRAIARNLSQVDENDDALTSTMQDYVALSSAPLRTRALAARYFANIGNVGESKRLLGEMMKLKPDLKESYEFNRVLDDPTVLGDTSWRGEGKQPIDENAKRRQEIEDGIRDWFNHLEDSRSRPGPRPPKDDDGSI